MGILSWIVLGLVAGVLAKFILPGRDPGGLVITILLGIGGAFVGGWIGTRLGIASFDGLTGNGGTANHARTGSGNVSACGCNICDFTSRRSSDPFT